MFSLVMIYTHSIACFQMSPCRMDNTYIGHKHDVMGPPVTHINFFIEETIKCDPGICDVIHDNYDKYSIKRSLSGTRMNGECRLKADSRLAPSQWDPALQSNAVSHWLGANLESAL